MNYNTHPLRILAVDDEPAVLRTLSTLLRRRGFSCETQSRPQQAAERLRAKPQIHILLTDLVMAEMDGFSLLRLVKTDGSLTQCIVMTAYSSLERLMMAYRMGVLDYLVKPFENLDVVLECVTAAEQRYSRWQRAAARTMGKDFP